MGSSRPTDRSLGEATFLPQWMKDRFDTRFDFSDSSFSPPADDNFFCIRYPNYHRETSAASVASNSKESFRSINEALNNKSETGNLLVNQADNSGYKEVKTIDFSKHPLSCQPFISVAAETVKEPKIIVANKAKYPTTDDDFNDTKTSECGRSIVHVANQIMSSKFGLSTPSDTSSAKQDKSDSNAQQQRKVSKSLPATPLASPSVTPEASPKSRRRVYGNRFFTGAFVTENNGEQQHQHQQHQPQQQQRPPPPHQKNGWLLASILGQSRELIVPKIEEEDEHQAVDPVPTPRALSRKKSISSQNLTYLGKDEGNHNNNNNNNSKEMEKQQQKLKQQQQSSSASSSANKPTQEPVHVNVLQPKPSELREMNFWSPTSM